MYCHLSRINVHRYGVLTVNNPIFGKPRIGYSSRSGLSSKANWMELRSIRKLNRPEPCSLTLAEWPSSQPGSERARMCS